MATLLETTREYQVLPHPSVPGYEILEEIGRGGMGVVYKARHIKLGRLVALKVLLPELDQSPEKISRFQIEANAVARLQHPSIVQIFEVGEFDGRPFLVLELVEGGHLADKLGTSWPAGSAVAFVELLARAIHFAHERGIVHRDLKPANILLASREGVSGENFASSIGALQHSRLNTHQPKITDFGLAKLLDEDASTSPRNWHTQLGVVLGSPPYMAPEQAAGRTHDIGPATDIHALGMILYEMLTARLPFRGATLLETLEQVKSQVPLPPSKVVPTIGKELDAICLRCLEKNPRRRYPTAQALAMDLSKFSQSLAKRSLREKTTVMNRARRYTALAFKTLLAIISALGSGLTVWQISRVVKEARIENDRIEKVEGIGGEKLGDPNQSVNRQTSLHALDRGLGCCNQGNVAQAMLWFARGLKEAPANDPRLQVMIRANMVKWRANLNALHFVFPTSGQVDRVGFSGDGKIAFTLSHFRSSAANQYTKVCFWNLSTGHQILEPIVRKELVTHAALTADGTTIVLAGPGNSAWLFDIRTGQPIGQPLSHNGEVTCISVSPNSQLVLTGSTDHTAQFWNAKTSQPIGPPLQHLGAVTAVAFSPDSATAATASDDGVARLWNAVTARSEGLLMKHNSGIRALAFSPNGRMLLTGSDDRSACLWDTPTGRRIGQPFVHADRVLVVAFSSDGKRIATGSADRTVRIWKTDKATPELIMSHASAVKAVQFSRDGRKLLTSSLDFTSQLWDFGTGKLEGNSLSGPDKVTTASFSPDGTRILTGNQNGWGKLWELDGGSQYQGPDQTWKTPDLMTGGVDQIVAWVERVTGAKIDSIHDSDSQELFAVQSRDN
jgi:serine/threonine protein kinase/WD40 repeat protein